MSDSERWTMEDWAGFDQGVKSVNASVTESLIKTWTCRHCQHKTPLLCEVCDGCGVMDNWQGQGEDRTDTTKRYSTGLWTPDAVVGMVRGLVK